MASFSAWGSTSQPKGRCRASEEGTEEEIILCTTVNRTNPSVEQSEAPTAQYALYGKGKPNAWFWISGFQPPLC